MDRARYDALEQYLQSRTFPGHFTARDRSNLVRDSKLYELKNDSLFRKTMIKKEKRVPLPEAHKTSAREWTEGVHWTTEMVEVCYGFVSIDIFQEKLLRKVILVDEVETVCAAAHLACGHGGRNKMCQELRDVWWIGMEASILAHSSCALCETKKNYRRETALRHMFYDYPMHCLQFDLTFYKPGNACMSNLLYINKKAYIILTTICHFSKRGAAWLIPSKESKHVVRRLNELAITRGVKATIYHSDNGGGM